MGFSLFYKFKGPQDVSVDGKLWTISVVIKCVNVCFGKIK